EGRLRRVLSIGERVHDFVRPMLRHVGSDLRQPGDEAGIAHELRRHDVVGMAPGRRWCDDNAWAKAADWAGESLARRRIVQNSSIGKVEVLSRRETHDLCRAT